MAKLYNPDLEVTDHSDNDDAAMEIIPSHTVITGYEMMLTN